ncbi:MAG: SDR family oxidoreductase [Acidimicrobiia bacterium]
MHEELERAFSLDGRVAVVTGAASGIGRQVAVTFAQAGADLVLADVVEAGLQETRALVEGVGGRAEVRPTNVADREAVDALAEAAVAAFGRLDVWANVAGIIRYAPLVDAPEAEIRSVVDVNLLGVYWGVAAAGRVMTAQGSGAIVNVASGGADVGSPTIASYGMTKAGVNHLTKTAALEFGPSGVRVNAVAPGWVETPMVAPYFTDADGNVDPEKRAEVIASRASVTPLNLTGEPTDISYAILYLASDASRFMTGQTLRPNGGFFMT